MSRSLSLSRPKVVENSKGRDHSHLLNRLGLGTNETDLAFYRSYSTDELINALVDFEKTPQSFPVSIYELYFGRDGGINLDPSRVTMHWLFKMVCTKRPLEEKLALFLHNHFAVSGAKSDFGPMMEGYLEAIRRNIYEPFPSIVQKVCLTPAMIKWLDLEENKLDHPNENFAREVMELFTLGIGNYSEQDVKRAASCFCGFGLRYLYYEVSIKDDKKRLEHCLQHGIPLIAHSVLPEVSDARNQSILGQQRIYSANSLLDMLANRPETDRRLLSRLWTFFAGTEPSSKILENLTKVYRKNGLSLRPVVREICHMPEFWAKDVVGTMVKSPIDLTIGAYRQARANKKMLEKRGQPATNRTPLAAPVEEDLYEIQDLVNAQGLLPLYPPDVSGWNFGQNWVTSATLPKRADVADTLFYTDRPTGATGLHHARSLSASAKGLSTKALAERICQSYSVKLDDARIGQLAKVIEWHGGPDALKDDKKACKTLQNVSKLIFWAPEYHLC